MYGTVHFDVRGEMGYKINSVITMGTPYEIIYMQARKLGLLRYMDMNLE